MTNNQLHIELGDETMESRNTGLKTKNNHLSITNNMMYLIFTLLMIVVLLLGFGYSV